MEVKGLLFGERGALTTQDRHGKRPERLASLFLDGILSSRRPKIRRKSRSYAALVQDNNC